ncbi:MAG: phospho-N-acetylmuramoyl-pentapeptide-transferase [bacterium]|nr:phospho-N-acetylmuramoyl-pentapeptide-transferase [bacterium]
MGMKLEFLVVVAISFMSSLGLGKIVIPWLQVLKFGQVVRSDGPKTHLSKMGTPTMGGIIFIIPTLIILWVVSIWRGYDTLGVVFVTLMTVLFGLIGLVDDGIKVVLKRPLGLLARQKILLQFLVAAIGIFVLWLMKIPTHLDIPMIGYRLELGGLYWLLMIILLLATPNAINITDGVDGLATVVMICASLAYAIIALATGNEIVLLLSLTLVATLLGFLHCNRHPARVFMGDVGAFALGGALAAMAVLTKTELLLPIIGGVFVIEMLSVIIQVIYFRMTGGRRIFRMSPLHHHFELCGWTERQVVLNFGLMAIICGGLGLLMFYFG